MDENSAANALTVPAKAWTAPSETSTTIIEIEKPVCGIPKAPPKSNRFTILMRSTYRWLFTSVVALNIVGLVLFFYFAPRPYPRQNLATAITANLTITILSRQDYVFNSLYKLCRIIPHSVPVKIRYVFVRIYEYGGIHSGSAFCALAWFLIFTVFLSIDFKSSGDIVTLVLNYLVLLILLAIVITAYPGSRFVHHNTFEFFHRYGGWTVLAIFWVEIIVYTKNIVGGNLGLTLVKEPSFWLLLFLSCHIVLPWLRLHKIECDPEKLSDHAVRLHHKEKLALYRGLAISEHPLGEWHSFASIPNRDGTGGSLLISHAGDWTRKAIDSPRNHYYVKGLPRTGVLALVNMFRSAVIVTTGSGIGPVFGIAMDAPNTRIRLVWSARDPMKTYGASIMDSLRHIDPETMIIDTSPQKGKRPNLVGITQELVREIDAEAIFIISNRTFTMKLINEFRDLGLHAYGPNWDS